MARKYYSFALGGNTQRHVARNIVSLLFEIYPYEVGMQVLCRSTNGHAETHCCVCGQGFVMFWERQSRIERMAALHEIQETLRRHHHASPGPEAHPKENFPVPEQDAEEAFSGAVLAGAVPYWKA